MKIYNSLSRTKEEFIPQDRNDVKMYACGITVYDRAHVGHARQAITYEMFTEYLRFRGYKITYVRNYTDVDDKIIAKANEEGVNALDYSKRKIIEVEEDLAKLKVKEPDIKPRASEYIDKIIEFTKSLIEKGYAYATQKGDVYFSVRKFPEYGKLSNRNPDEMLNGVRIEIEEGKEDPIDFALWKSAKEGEIYWESPWGKGRPGWHIECSTMAMNCLGETIDIHGGGKDLIFPHHENEIAQSEAFTGKKFAKYWTHNGLIKVNGQKMSKSLGNSLTIKDALEQYDAEVIRYTMLSKHYSTDVDLGQTEFLQAERHLYYFYKTLSNVQTFLKENNSFKDLNAINSFENSIESDFIEAMDDDFNSSAAISHMFNICKNLNSLIQSDDYTLEQKIKNLSEITSTVQRVYGVLGLFQQDPYEFVNNMMTKYLMKLNISNNEIENIIKERANAKLSKNYPLADDLRNVLLEKGIILNDSTNGTTWDLKDLYYV